LPTAIPNIDRFWIEIKVEQYGSTFYKGTKKDMCAKEVALPDKFTNG
jgi:hypothetical protein